MTTRRWGLITTIVYALIVALLVVPLVLWEITRGDFDQIDALVEIYAELLSSEAFSADMLLFWSIIAILVLGQASLLFVTVGRSGRRLPPQRRLIWSVVTVMFTIGLLAAAATASVIAAVRGDNMGAELWLVLVVWVVCGIVFYAYRHGISDRLDRLLGWLIRGSVLELLIAVPCHVIVRQRNDCCAPGVTGLGIATGIAVMLMTIGPGVWFLYQKRFDQYSRKQATDRSADSQDRQTRSAPDQP
jgi:hypothetical protein